MLCWEPRRSFLELKKKKKKNQRAISVKAICLVSLSLSLPLFLETPQTLFVSLFQPGP